MNWFDALQCCYYQQGYLAEPQNQAEQDAINSYLTICEWQISRLDISNLSTLVVSYWRRQAELLVDGSHGHAS